MESQTLNPLSRQIHDLLAKQGHAGRWTEVSRDGLKITLFTCDTCGEGASWYREAAIYSPQGGALCLPCEPKEGAKDGGRSKLPRKTTGYMSARRHGILGKNIYFVQQSHYYRIEGCSLYLCHENGERIYLRQLDSEAEAVKCAMMMEAGLQFSSEWTPLDDTRAIMCLPLSIWLVNAPNDTAVPVHVERFTAGARTHSARFDTIEEATAYVEAEERSL